MVENHGGVHFKTSYNFKILLHFTFTVEVQWLEHLMNHENLFEEGIVRANDC